MTRQHLFKEQAYLYKFGEAEAEEWPPKTHTLPTTNQTAKKQSKAILKWPTAAFNLQKQKTS